jgi:hypothetical protein
MEQRKRNLLVLILHHLREEGFLESAEALVKESGSSIANYQVCDNIDLSTVLQVCVCMYTVMCVYVIMMSLYTCVCRNTNHTTL